MSDELFFDLIDAKPGASIKARPNAAYHLLTAQTGGNGGQMLTTAMDRLKLASQSNSGDIMSLIMNITLIHQLPGGVIDSMMEDILEVAMQHPDFEDMLKWTLALCHYHCTSDINIAQFYDYGALDVALNAAKKFANNEAIVAGACAVITHFNCFPLGDGLQRLVALLDIQQESERALSFVTKTVAELTAYVGGTSDHTEKMTAQVVGAGVLEHLKNLMELFPNSERVQTQSARIVANIVSTANEDNIKKVETSGIVNQVVSALKLFPRKEPLQTHVFHVLGGVPGGATTLESTVEEVVNALKAADSEQLRFEAIRTLSNTATNVKDMKPFMVQRGIVPLVLTAMETCTHLPALCEEAGNLISHLAFDSENISASLASAGAVTQVLGAMRRFPNEEDVLTANCAAIAGLTFNNQQAQQAVLDNKGAKVIVEAMKHGESWRLQEMGAMAIGTMCWDANLKAAIVEEGGIKVLCKALAENLEQPSLVKNACRALAQIAFNSEAYRTDMANLGAIPLIIKAMELHPAHDRTQMHGCVALSYLSWTNEINAAEIASHNGYKVIVQAMKNHNRNAEVQENACRALANISSMTLTSANDFLTAIIDAMALHENSPEVQEEACRAIVTLSLVSTANKDLLEKLGAAPLVVKAMQAYPRTYLVQQEACNALAHLAYEHAALNKQVTDLQGVALILAAMKAHPAICKVQLNGCGALSALAFDNPTAQMQIFDLGGVDAVITGMQKFDRMRMLELGCSVLGTLAWNPKIKEKVAITAIPSILEAMRTHADIALLQKSTCRAISQFAFNSENNRQLLYKSQAIPLICKSLRSHLNQEKLVAHALVALTYLCWENSDVAQSIVDEGAEDLLRQVQDEYRGKEKIVNKAVHLQKILTRKSGQSPQPGMSSPPVMSPQPGLHMRTPGPAGGRNSKSTTPQPELMHMVPPSPAPRDDSDRYYLGRKPEPKKKNERRGIDAPPAISSSPTGNVGAPSVLPTGNKVKVGNMMMNAEEDWCIEDELKAHRKQRGKGNFSTGKPLEDAELARNGDALEEPMQGKRGGRGRRGGNNGAPRGGRGGAPPSNHFDDSNQPRQHDRIRIGGGFARDERDQGGRGGYNRKATHFDANDNQGGRGGKQGGNFQQGGGRGGRGGGRGRGGRARGGRGGYQD